MSILFNYLWTPRAPLTMTKICLELAVFNNFSSMVLREEIISFACSRSRSSRRVWWELAFARVRPLRTWSIAHPPFSSDVSPLSASYGMAAIAADAPRCCIWRLIGTCHFADFIFTNGRHFFRFWYHARSKYRNVLLDREPLTVRFVLIPTRHAIVNLL